MAMNIEKEEKKPKVELQILDKPQQHTYKEQDSDITNSPANSANGDDVDIVEELFPEKAFGCLNRYSKPRIWAINVLLWPYFETITMMVILCNGVTLGMYDPYDNKCTSHRCKTLEVIETAIYSFFVFEMIVKIIAMGFCGPLGYLSGSWNRLDFFIVCASTFEYLYGDGEYLSSIRAARVLRPLRAINKVPSIRILVALLLDTLPMLGNVLAICTLIFVVFGIIGVQLWQGVLRNRCALELPTGVNTSQSNISSYYMNNFEYSLICSLATDNGIVQCTNDFIPNYSASRFSPVCKESYESFYDSNTTLSNSSCVNWNQYYSQCRQVGDNPHHGAISFDHTGLAIVAIFQVITLEGWSKIMYYLQDSYSPWVWIYFVALIVIGAYFMTNLCLVVIASQFSETRQRESALIEQANRKARLLKSYSTLSGSISSYTFKDQGCYAAILGIMEDAYKRLCKRLRKKLAGTRFCKPIEKKKMKRRVVKKREKHSTTSTIHLHHHHHHHFHHHHHICSSDQANSTSGQIGDCSSHSPNILQPSETGRRSALRTPTIVAIDNEFRDPRVGVASVCPVAIQSTALLMPDTTVLICRQPSPRSPQPTHTVSFYSTSLNDKSGFSDEIPLKSSEASYEFPSFKRKRPTVCPNVEQFEADIDGRGYEEIYRSSSSDDEEEEIEEVEVPGLCSRMSSKMKAICESNPFKIIIMSAILLNTVMMGIEHHGQPKELTDTLEIFNFIFTIVFVIEFISKVIGYGPYGYIKDSFNLFDGTIVIISVIEIFGDTGSGVSVLRTLRLMRIFKLIRFMSSLQKQITVMVKTLDSVMTFLALLIIFIFTVSILGMHLFGAKMNRQGNTVRHNFDSLLWALMTTFQVLTQEDWPSVMYDAMEFTSKWAALYFIILMTIGNYILFNLLVAILVEGFSNDPKLRKMLKPKSKLQIKCKTHQQGEEEELLLEDKQGEEATNALHQDTSYDCQKRSHLTKCTGRCQRRPSLIRSVSDVGRSSCQQIASLHSKCKVKSLPDLALKYNEPVCDFIPEKLVRCDSHFSLKEPNPPAEDDTLLRKNKNFIELPIQSDDGAKDGKAAEKRTCLRDCLPTFKFLEDRKDYSLYLLAPNNWFRRFNLMLCTSKWFDRVILVFIFFNCVVLAMESPDLDQNGAERRFIDSTNNVFTFVFLTEMVIKVLAYGFTVGDTTYLKSGWNVMDCLLVVISLIDFFVTRYSEKKSSFLGVLKVFRALRTLRPLRVISRAPGLKLVVETLMSSLKPIGNLLVIAGVFFTIFGILGVQIFKGSFYYCFNPSGPVETKAECLLRGGSWRNREYNFDNLLKAMLTLFVFSTKDGWVALMHHGIDAVGVDKQPVKNHNPWAFLYFFSFLLIAGFVVINMVVGVIIDNFHRCRDQIEAIDGAKKNIQTIASHIVDGDISQSLFDTFPVWRRVLYTIVTHYKFDIMIATVIGLNVFFMAVEHYKMSATLSQFLKILNFIFTGIFVLEASMKILAFGIKTFISERWNQLDLFIVALSIVGIVLEELNESLPINPTIIRIMRVLRITRVLKILKSANGIQKLLNCLSQTLPQVGNLSMLFMLLFFIFSSLGMELFGKLDCSRDVCQGLNRHAHFRNFGYAMLTLFRISTGDSWSGLMKDTLNREICVQDCDMLYWVSPIYFAIFVLSTQFVLVNVVVAVLMKQLEDSKDSRTSSNCNSISDMDDIFSNDPKNSQYEEEDYDDCLKQTVNCNNISLTVGDEADDNSNMPSQCLQKGDWTQRDVSTTNEFSSQEVDVKCDDHHQMDDQQTMQLKANPELLDSSSSYGEYGLENAIIVVSPAHDNSFENSFIPHVQLEDDDFYEVKSDSSLEPKDDCVYTKTTFCRSMPELYSPMREDSETTLLKTKESNSCPYAITSVSDESLKIKCKRKKTGERPFLARRRSRSKVAPLVRGLTVPSQTLSVEFEKDSAIKKMFRSASEDIDFSDEYQAK
ncbi:voltage-dependent T-type calcium channel subunit alpha-1H-like isoform X3 [Rhopilema esculentum]|uniref:voltage-dependent T-type calcium channel subunit alpha-1H-like isoform X3 n=1 Tax=Rhopilema esculentum TaxID=499914 RepID=UPI0031D17C1A